MRDGAVGMGSFDVESEGGVGGSVADAALQDGVRFHGGVACPELVGKPLEGVREAEAEGAEALAVALVRGTSRAVVPPTMRSLKT